VRKIGGVVERGGLGGAVEEWLEQSGCFFPNDDNVYCEKCFQVHGAQRSNARLAGRKKKRKGDAAGVCSRVRLGLE
jgi:hypothetical protein